MKKILFASILSIFFVACCPKKIEQSYFTITKIESMSQDEIHSDTTKTDTRSFCKYRVEDSNHQIDVIDTIGKFKVGDTLVFRIRTTI